jgi:hypothetical protein
MSLLTKKGIIMRDLFYPAACIALMVILLCPHSQAADNYDDVVLLDNGAVLQGKILPEESDAKILKIEREDGYVIEIPRKRIRLITKAGDPAVDSLQAKIVRARRVPEIVTEWKRFIRAGVYNGESKDVVALSVGFGLVVQQNFLIATGIGWDHYSQGEGIPLFLEFSGYISKGNVLPYWYLDLGVTPFIAVSGTGEEGDYFLGWGIGFTVPVGEELGAGALVGYRTQSFVDGNIGLITFMGALHF